MFYSGATNTLELEADDRYLLELPSVASFTLTEARDLQAIIKMGLARQQAAEWEAFTTCRDKAADLDLALANPAYAQYGTMKLTRLLLTVEGIAAVQ